MAIFGAVVDARVMFPVDVVGDAMNTVPRTVSAVQVFVLYV